MAIEDSLHRRLVALPALERRPEDSLRCKVCGNPAIPFDIVDFNKCSAGYPFGFADVAVPWHRCAHCGFLFTAFFDDWSEHDFARFVYNDDYIKVDPDYAEIRPRLVAERMAKMLAGYKDARILDYGSGRGVWVQQMREHGFAHVDGYDPFAQPVRPEGRYDLITCLEVIEHSPRPVETLAEMAELLTDDGCILLGESLQPNNIFEARCSWWYAAPRNGHCSTFADRTLAYLAKGRGCCCIPASSRRCTRCAGGNGLPTWRVRSVGPSACSAGSVRRAWPMHRASTPSSPCITGRSNGRAIRASNGNFRR